jgi:hypothetical protein
VPRLVEEDDDDEDREEDVDEVEAEGEDEVEGEVDEDDEEHVADGRTKAVVRSQSGPTALAQPSSYAVETQTKTR